MPRRPTSTPTPSPSRRMMNVMVTGQFRAYRLDEADQALLFSTLPPSAATSLKQAVTFKMGCFFCLRGTCYIYMSLSRRPCGLRAAVRSPATLYPRKREFPDPDPAGVRHKNKEECDGTHANRPETRIFQRRPTQGGNYWLRLRRSAAGAALR